MTDADAINRLRRMWNVTNERLADKAKERVATPVDLIATRALLSRDEKELELDCSALARALDVLTHRRTT